MKNSLLLIVIPLFIMTSCHKCHNNKNELNNSNDYGVNFNHVRDSIGLAAFNEGWIPHKKEGEGYEEHTIIWYDPDIDSITVQDKGNYVRKIITTMEPGDKIMNESDVFVRPINFINWDKKKQYIFLFYTYVFIPAEEYYNTGWYYRLFNCPDDSKNGLITKHVADSILNSWGLSYPPVLMN